MFTFKFYEYTNTDSEGNPKQIIKAVSSYAGSKVTAFAVLHPDDVYDYNKGTKIAEGRCRRKLYCKKISHFKEKCRKIDKEIAFYRDYIKTLEKRSEAYKKTIAKTEMQMSDCDTELNELLGN